MSAKTSSHDAADATKRSTAFSQLPLEFSGREPLEFLLELQPESRALWVARRLEVYRDLSVQYAAAIVRQRGNAKVTVAEAEAQAVMETDGLTKSIPLEAPLYDQLLKEEPRA